MTTAEVSTSSRFSLQKLGSSLVYLALAAFIAWLVSAEPTKATATAARVGGAVSLSAAVFIGANKLFDETRERWQTFLVVAGGLFGALIFGWLEGNRLLDDLGLGRGWKASRVPWLLFGAVAFGGLLWVVDSTTNLKLRRPVAAAWGLGVGLGMGFAIVEESRPALDWFATPLWTAAVGLVFASLGYLRGNQAAAERLGVLGLGFGWLLGAWGASDIGGGSLGESLLAAGVLGALIGLRVGYSKQYGEIERARVENGARKYIFLAPALTFIFGGLLIPLVRTIFLSLHDETTDDFVGLSNFKTIFTSDASLNISGWSNVFTSQLLWIGAFIIAIGVGAGLISRRRGHDGFELASPSTPVISFGGVLVAFAILSVLRGSIFNNIWWVLTVTLLSSVFGLAIAQLADKANYENVAKSFIFMPMAISFVGAGIIWRFMYIARDSSKPQTGVMNSLWIWLGQISNNSTHKAIFATILGLAVIGLLAVALSGWRAQATSVLVGASVASLPFAILLVKLLYNGLGGFVVNGDGQSSPEALLFLTENQPFNNLWLMVVLIWIQTGFAMVIFSSAIKGVSREMIEAAEVDGATETQVFWRITIPQIAPTIGVVVTTLIVVVMKVFDIVKVMTNGNFDTEVVANEMWQRAFTELNFGLGSALAVLLFISVVPIMYYNIRKMQEERS